MIINFEQEFSLLALLLLVDFLWLLLSRKFHFPDYIAHILTGLCLGLISSKFQLTKGVSNLNTIVDFQDIFTFLTYLGVFFFYFEFGYRTLPKTYQVFLSFNWQDILAFFISVSLLFSLSAPLVSIEKVRLVTLVFLPISFLACDFAAFAVQPKFNHNDSHQYLEFIKMTLALEIVALIYFGLFDFIFFLELQKVNLRLIIVFCIGLMLFWLIAFSRLRLHFIDSMQKWPIFLLIIGILLAILSFLIHFKISVIIVGAICGFLLNMVLKNNRIFSQSIPFTVTRFFIIFPMIAVGSLLSQKLYLLQLLLNFLIILFILIISAFLLLILRIRRRKKTEWSVLEMMHRGEFSLLMLLWGYLNNLVSAELIAGVVLLSILVLVFARFKKLMYFFNLISFLEIPENRKS